MLPKKNLTILLAAAGALFLLAANGYAYSNYGTDINNICGATLFTGDCTFCHAASSKATMTPAKTAYLAGGSTLTDFFCPVVAPVNQPPVANAGPDQTAVENDTVTLNGSNSNDPDHDALTYAWKQTKGVTVSLSNAAAVKPTFTAPIVGASGGSLTFQLTVKDSGGLTSTDTCIVNINPAAAPANEPPVANAGPDQIVDSATTVYLDASNSSDPDDGIASYMWKQTAGPAVTLSNTMNVSPTFTAPDGGANGVSLTFQVTVTDFGGLQSTDTTIVNVNSNGSVQNLPPVADAGPDQSATSGVTVALDGSNSSDPDDGIASYRWVQTAGPSVTLSDSTAVQPTFTAPAVSSSGASLTFKLTVTDAGGLVSSDTCTVQIAAGSTSGSGSNDGGYTGGDGYHNDDGRSYRNNNHRRDDNHRRSSYGGYSGSYDD